MILDVAPFVKAPVILIGDWSVVPGERVGGVSLLQDEQRMIAPLGKPAGGDGATGHHWTTWIGWGGGRIDIYATLRPNRDRPLVVEVRASSPRFHLSDGLRTGLPAVRFRDRFPAARKVGGYRTTGGRVELWDDVRRGLAWESKAGRTLALIVHPRGERLRGFDGTYQSAPLPRIGG